MGDPLFAQRAQLQIRLRDMLRVPGGHSGFFHFMMPACNGGTPDRTQYSIAHEIGDLGTMRAVAEAIVRSEEAQEAIRAWNDIVSPAEDPLRFVREWLPS